MLLPFPARPSPDRPFPVRRSARAAAIALAAALVLAGCSDEPDTRSAAGSASDGSSNPDGSPSSSPSPSSSDGPSEPAEEPGSGSSDEPAGTAVPVYWVGDGAGGRSRLFREFQRVEGDPLTEAAALVAGNGGATDPDYRTLWPQVEISSVTATDGILLVEIPSDGFTERPDGMTRRDARLALQQLVYTLQGVQQERVPVVIARPDTVPRLFGLATGGPVRAASPLETLNLVNITSPAEGESVTGDTLTVTGVANSFEASGPCRLVVGGEEVALEAYQSDGWMEDKLFPFEVELPLDGIIGEVVVQCETDDPSGGAEGNGPSIDTRTIRVG